MKIGILTLPLVDNYGGILQAIALYRFLHEEGHDVILINKKTNIPIWKKIVKCVILNIPYYDFKDLKKKNNSLNKKKELHKSFINKEIFKISKTLSSKKDLLKYADEENFDAVIVGSDQVWRKAYINDKYYKSYFLDFINNKKTKKIAYAASFGKGYWEGKNDINEVSLLLQKFTSLSTRESTGQEICKNIFMCNDVVHVLDPTLLMSKNFYINTIIKKNNISNLEEHKLLTYVLDEVQEKKEIISTSKEKLNIQKVQHLKGFNNTKKIFTIPEWLAAFAYTDFIVTDSFHGMVFSIIFEKDFLVIGNKNRGIDRFLSLLRLLNLESRLIFNKQDITNEQFNTIDYDKINKILNVNKEKSMTYLKNSLNDSEN